MVECETRNLGKAGRAFGDTTSCFSRQRPLARRAQGTIRALLTVLAFNCASRKRRGVRHSDGREHGGPVALHRLRRGSWCRAGTRGDRVLLFLRPVESGAHPIVEYSLGMFWESTWADEVQVETPGFGRRSR